MFSGWPSVCAYGQKRPDRFAIDFQFPPCFFVLIRMCTKLEKRWQCVISKPLGTFNIASHHITYFNIKHVLLTYIRPQVPATADSIRVYDLRHRLRQISAYNIQRNGSLLRRRTRLVHIHSLRFNYTQSVVSLLSPTKWNYLTGTRAVEQQIQRQSLSCPALLFQLQDRTYS